MSIRIYVVGGYVRDLLLKKYGIEATPSDKDWVVVGASPEYMVSRGFLPVGADFPVFLHPKTHDEYALARTERKTAPGYRGFAFSADPGVTLEEDLRRRDLTINAIAMEEDGTLHDPWGGEADIRNRIFRHVSLAFCEDPVRILRLARFAARLPEFTVHPDTEKLIRSMVASGEADALVPERVLKELSRGLMEKRPSRMMEVLLSCGAWERVAPGVPYDEEIGRKLELAARLGASADIRLLVLLSKAEKPDETGVKLRFSADSLALIRLWMRTEAVMRNASSAEDAVTALEKSDFFRRPARFEELLLARRILSGSPEAPWRKAAEAVQRVIPAEVVPLAKTPREIPAVLHAARVKAAEESGFLALLRESHIKTEKP